MTKQSVTVDPVNVSGTYWAKVRPLGLSTECFVSAQYLDVVQSGGGLTPTVPGTVTTGPYKVGDIIVTTATVNLRTDAGTNNPIVRSISSNTTGTVMAGYKKVGSDDWVQVQFPTGNGWVAARYTRLVTSSTPGGPYAAGEKVVATSIVNLRIAPGTTSTALAQLQIGEQGIALGAQATVGTTIWVQVEFPAGSGWVSAAYLKRFDRGYADTGALYLECRGLSRLHVEPGARARHEQQPGLDSYHQHRLDLPADCGRTVRGRWTRLVRR